MRLEDLARVPLAQLPTPLVRAEKLSQALGGPTVWIKRDDLTGLAFGGNKVRKLEFILADALAQGCDYVLTVGAAQSNHACQTAAAARCLGLRPLLVIAEDTVGVQGNLLLDRLLDAELKILPAYAIAHLHEAMEEEATRLRAAGHQPYVIPVGGHSPLGVMGYVAAAQEAHAQLAAQGVACSTWIHASGSGGTQGGLVLGARHGGIAARVIGVNVGARPTRLREETARVASEAAALLGEAPVTVDMIEVNSDYVGARYADLTADAVAAIRLVAQTEGIFLDPVYTAKAMAGLIDLCRRGEFGAKDHVVFWHTGGGPGIFARAAELVAALESA
jgi:D-cysteine desulfhydrase family pyridoxal phosphate-dependent enzyme